MKIAAVLAVAGLAFAAQADVYSDALGDISVPNDNLDIKSVTMTNDSGNLYVTVETKAYANWTKYLFFFDTTSASGRGDNGWGRPIDLNGRLIDRYVGAWVDQPSNNTQLWSDVGSWSLSTTISNDQSQTASNKVSFVFPLSFIGLSANSGASIYFDVATSGGGSNDPGIDHLSTSNPSTPGWGTQSVAGTFARYDLVPAPGAMGTLALAGLAAARRRRA
jgi:hypothetical protein